MTKKELKPFVKKCLSEMMDVGVPKDTKSKGKGDGVEKTIKTTNQVIDALAAGKIDAETAKKLIAKIARTDIERATLVATPTTQMGGGCRY